jgi:hypothetical protein
MTVHEILQLARSIVASNRFALARPLAFETELCELHSSMWDGYKNREELGARQYAQHLVFEAMKRRGFEGYNDFSRRGSQAIAVEIVEDAIRVARSQVAAARAHR